jgi:AcrR family transcriptional regulator
VYRYFPDRLAVWQGLASRAADRLLARVRSDLETAGPDFAERLDIVFAALVRAHRGDTGFRVVCVFESMQVLGPQGAEGRGPEIVQPLLELAAKGGKVDDDHLTAFLVGEALIHRAFAADLGNDDDILDRASRAARRFVGVTV